MVSILLMVYMILIKNKNKNKNNSTMESGLGCAETCLVCDGFLDP